MDYNKLTKKELVELILDRGLKVPNKGRGTRGGVLNGDLVLVLKKGESGLDEDFKSRTRIKSSYNKYTVGELEKELERMNIEVIVGTGKGGRVLKKDMLKRLKDGLNESFQPEKAGEGIFLKNVQTDVLRKMLYDVDLDDVLNFCRVNVSTYKTVCNEYFWQTYAKKKGYDSKHRIEYKTWKSFVVGEGLVNPMSLEFILKQELRGIWDRKKAEEYIALNYESITFVGNVIHFGIVDDEREKRDIWEKKEEGEGEEGGGEDGEGSGDRGDEGRDDENLDRDDEGRGDEVMLGYGEYAHKIEPFFVVYDFEFEDLEVVDGNQYDNPYEDAIVVYDSGWDDNLGPSFSKGW